MRQKFISLVSSYLENGSGMNRKCFGIDSFSPRKLFTLLFVLLLAVGQMWGADVTYKLTIDANDFNTTSYAANNNEKTSNAVCTTDNTKTYEVKWTSNQVMKNSNNMQWQKSKGYIYNSTDLGTISNVTVTSSAGSFTTYYGTSAQPSSGSSGSGKGYFKTSVGGATGTTSSVVITFVISEGGGDTPSVSADPEDWDFGAVATDASASKVFSVSGSNLTAGTLTLTTPSGYSVSPASITVASAGDLDATNVTVSKNTSTAGTYNGNLTISGCGLEDDVEVALAMEVKAKYTVTWNNNGVTSTSQVLDGEKPVFPATPASCDATSTTFIGWAVNSWSGKVATPAVTVYTKAADMPAVSAAVTYYAVFAKVSGTSGWNLTDIADLTSSDVFVLADASNYALNNDGGTSNAPSTNAITVSDGKITSEVADKLKWNISGNATDGYTFYPNGTDESWLYCNTTASSSSNNCMRVGTGDRKVFEVNASGYLVTKDTYTTRYLSRYNNQDFRGYVNTNTNPVQPKCYKYSAGLASDYMTTCCTKYNVNIAAGITNGTVSADLAQACEGATVTLTFTPALNYYLSGWTLNGTAQDVNDNTFTMPAEAVTVSATFAQDACDPLGTPSVTVSGKAYPYDAVKLAWTAISNADAYKVYIYDNEDNELEHNDAFTGVEYTIGQTLGGSTTYKYSVQAVSNTPATYCPSTEVESTFTTDALPTAHLTLMNLGVEHASSGDYAILTPFNLPTTAAACSKAFVGWDANPDCATAPTYAPGAEFTFSNTTGVTLYAVYADVTGGGASYTLTPAASVSEGVYVIAAYYTNYKAFTGEVTTGTNNDLSNETTGFTIDGDKKIESLPAEACEFTFTAVSGGFSISKANGDYLGYSSTSNRRIAFATSHSDKVWNATALSKDGYPDDGLYISTSAYKISGNGSSPSLGRGYGSNTYNPLYLFKKTTTPGTPSNWSTSCVAAPEAIVDPEELNVAAAGVANGIIEADYDNVNESAVAVSLWNNQACDEAFDGGWLTASINGDKNIAYTIAENTSYNDARTAYIKLTAPETTGATDPAVVIIPVLQAKKAAVFSSLEELVAADVNANTNVTVSFSNVVIKDIYYYNSNRRGLIFNIQKADEDIKIYYNADVPAEWVGGGKVSGTLTDCPWKTYNDAWQLAPTSGWAWANLEYTEPASVSSVAVSGTPTKTTYNTGEAFDPAGLTVTVTYSDESVEAITSNDANWAYVTWNVDPATFAAEHIGTGKSVSVIATYNAVASSAAEISGLTVNKVAVTGVTLNQDAATLKAGKTLTLTAIVAPANASIKSVNWSTSDGSIATVDNGVVTAVAEGSATITATSTDDNTKTASCAITVVAGINFAAGDWTLVTDAAELTAGSYVIIAAAGYDKAMKSYESGNNCKAEDATKSGDLLTYDEDFGIFEVGDYEISDVTYKTFQDAETDQYLYISSNENRLQAQDTKNENAAWTITSVSDAGKAVVTSKSQSGRTMRYNDNSDLFACYASGQKDIALYKYYAPVPKVTYNKNTEDEVTGLPAVQKTEWETDAYKATVAAGPSRTGYTFTGWNSAAEGNGDAYAAGTKYSFAEDITLYAQWEALTAHHVTYVTVGTAPTDEDSYYVGDYVTLASAAGLSNPGYVFDGWNDGTSTYAAGFNEYEMPDNDVTFTAVWSRKSSQKWVLVTDVANIKTDGTEYVIAGAEHNVAMGALNGSYYNSTSVTKNDNILTGTEQMIALTFEDGSEDGKLAIKHDTKYIYSTTVKNMGERDDSFDWEIVIADGVATISASVGYLKYNSQNPRFNTYASGQQPVAIYEKAENVVVTTSQSVSGISAGADVIVKNGGTLNVDADKSIGDLTVEAGGTVALSSNKLTVVGTFAIETSMATQNQHKSGQLTGATASNFAAAGEAYIDITLGAGATGDQWHAFTVPFPVDALNGIYDLDGGKLTNEVHYAIMDYHGDIRATGKYGWKKYRKTLVPGTFYLMTVDGLRTTYRFKKAAGAALVAENSKTIYEYAASGDGQNIDAGWNGIGNPTLSYGQVNVPVQVLDPDAYEYVTKTANSTNFVVGTPFFYKAGADGSISMVEASGIVNYAPARRTVREIKDVDITFGNEAYKDHLYISASEDALNSYEQDKDLVKMRMSKTPKVAQIMAEAYGCELSMVNAPMVNGEARYALSLYAPAAGEYTISSDAMALAEDGSQLYLTYNGYPMWNLTSSPMTVTLPKGNSTQFGLLITRPALMPTGVDEVTGYGLQVTGVEKLIIDDHIYILRDGKMYDVTGKAVK